MKKQSRISETLGGKHQGKNAQRSVFWEGIDNLNAFQMVAL